MFSVNNAQFFQIPKRVCKHCIRNSGNRLFQFSKTAGWFFTQLVDDMCPPFATEQILLLICPNMTALVLHQAFTTPNSIKHCWNTQRNICHRIERLSLSIPMEPKKKATPMQLLRLSKSIMLKFLGNLAALVLTYKNRYNCPPFLLGCSCNWIFLRYE